MSEIANTKPTRRTTVNAADFEKLMILMQMLPEPLDFRKKFRVVLEHNPDDVAIEIHYYFEDDSSSQQTTLGSGMSVNLEANNINDIANQIKFCTEKDADGSTTISRLDRPGESVAFTKEETLWLIDSLTQERDPDCVYELMDGI